MYCPNCGKEIKKNTLFCPYCGKELPNDSVETEETTYITEDSGNKGRKKIFIPILTVLVVAVIAGIGIFLLQDRQDMVIKNSTSNVDSVVQYDNGDTVYIPDEENISYDETEYVVYYDNLLIVYTLADLEETDAQALADQVGGTVVGDISGSINVLQIQVESTDLDTLSSYADTLMESDDVLYASYDMPMAITESDDSNPWSDGDVISDKNEDTPSGNDWWAEAIDAYSAWEYVDSHGDSLSDVIVGVLDSGFDVEHEDLHDITVLNYNSESDHGTHVAGIIAVENNNRWDSWDCRQG